MSAAPAGPRGIARRVRAIAVSEGAGVTMRRPLGLPALPRADPFLMLDHFSSDDPDDYGAGFPDHPHRGFVTFTHMLDGRMEHRDSMGNRGDLGPGGVQWMKAASGVIHSEMPRQIEGLLRGFQLWIDLPPEEKMGTPAYQEFAAERVPELDMGTARVRLLSGRIGGHSGPVQDPYTGLLYLDVSLARGATLDLPLDTDLTVLVYPYEGAVSLAGAALDSHELALLDTGSGLHAEAAGDHARLIAAAARPTGAPVVKQGPFVMNTREQIEQALRDYRDGCLVREAAPPAGH